MHWLKLNPLPDQLADWRVQTGSISPRHGLAASASKGLVYGSLFSEISDQSWEKLTDLSLHGPQKYKTIPSTHARGWLPMLLKARS